MLKSIFIFVAALSPLVFAGCAGSNDAHRHSAEPGRTPDDQPTTTFGGAYNVEFRTEPGAVRAGEPAAVAVAIKNERGEIARNLEIVHEKPLHLIIVSEDLAEFYHEHPEPQPDGSFRVQFTFPHGGRYRLFADFKPKGANQTAQNFTLEVEGEKRTAAPLAADAKLEKTIDGVKFTMKPETALEAGAETLIDFGVFDAAGAPIADLENYLGEKAHFVVISQNLQEYVHAHPLSTDNAAAHDHAEHRSEKLSSGAGRAAVAAHISFPKPGLYKIWAQFKRGGKILTAPFVVEVAAAKEEKSMLDEVKIPDGAIKIVVSRDGFTPQEISLKSGQPVRLAFIRTDAENCGGEVVFEKLNIKRKLPVGEVVTVDIPADKGGEIDFSCGMNMMRGKILIQ